MSATAAAVPRRSRRAPLWSATRRNIRQQPLASLGVVVLLLLGMAALFPGIFATRDPIFIDVPNKLLPPGSQFPFGTDELGRDVYARVVYGTGPTMLSGLGVVTISTAIGTLLGLIAGQRGGLIDGLIMRLSDVFLSFPNLIMVLAIISFFGPNLLTAMLALSLVWWPQYARLVRGQVLTVKELPFIEAARSIGSTDTRILVRHILPNCLVPSLVKASIDFSYAILISASLSFLGVGAQPPAPELGAMVASGRVYLLTSWWLTTFPSLVIFLAVLALNVVGDGIRDVLDPTLRVP